MNGLREECFFALHVVLTTVRCSLPLTGEPGGPEGVGEPSEVTTQKVAGLGYLYPSLPFLPVSPCQLATRAPFMLWEFLLSPASLGVEEENVERQRWKEVEMTV